MWARYCKYSHFTDVESKVREVPNLPKWWTWDLLSPSGPHVPVTGTRLLGVGPTQLTFRVGPYKSIKLKEQAIQIVGVRGLFAYLLNSKNDSIFHKGLGALMVILVKTEILSHAGGYEVPELPGLSETRMTFGSQAAPWAALACILLVNFCLLYLMTSINILCIVSNA